MNVAEHFGRCTEYMVVDIEGGKVRSRTIIPNPGHEPGFLPAYLERLGVSCIISGGMGVRAKQLFEDKRIETITG
ncbi:MAG: NifB/NifX family molybdenum-iron cluster-binding protein [Bacillota bacterium]